jgi:uncharacterized SAM-binding protein YcdF (DUF218 family)
VTTDQSSKIETAITKTALKRFRFAMLFVSFFIFAIAAFFFPSLYAYYQCNAHRGMGQEAILVLGGSYGSRERHAFALARKLDEKTEQNKNLQKTDFPPIKIWISTGRPKQEIVNISKQFDIPLDRVILDNRAIDTVTNFSSLAELLYNDQVTRVHVVTDYGHIKRSMTIAHLILGYYGIETVASPSSTDVPRPSEWRIRRWRDYARCVMWFYTSKSGARLNALKHIKKRMHLGSV